MLYDPASSTNADASGSPGAYQQPRPFAVHNGTTYWLLQGADLAAPVPRDLLYTTNARSLAIDSDGSFVLGDGEWIEGSTLRNSFFLEPFRQFTHVRDLQLVVECEGAASVRCHAVQPGQRGSDLSCQHITATERAVHILRLGTVASLPANTRLFWTVEAIDGPCIVHRIGFCTKAPPVKEQPRLAVLLRTFGRSADMLAVLQGFVESADEHASHAAVMEHIEFWVLDTTGNIRGLYAEEWLERMNVRVFEGPNLGGGGNASLVIKLLLDDVAADGRRVDEVVLMDDDLTISMESLARHYAFCRYRSKPALSSLPVLAKSEPMLVWEDGGYWGRMQPANGVDLGSKRTLFPTLIKHRHQIDGPNSLDAFCPLNTPEYSTFIFLAMPRETLEKLGYPAAFFLRGDDIELSLRAAAAGIPMFTNPNLAAWHEPGHSLPQEYMAILHGIIINLGYSTQGPEYYERFFEQRLAEHLSVNDLEGVRIYLTILEDLTAEDSPVLTLDFQAHYLDRLKRLASRGWTALTPGQVPAFERAIRDRDGLIVEFVYPGYHGQADRASRIVLHNTLARAYREVPAVAAAAKAELLRDYAARLASFTNDFERISERFRLRMKESARPEFWTAIRSRYAAEVNELTRGARPRASDAVGSDSIPVIVERASLATLRQVRALADAGLRRAASVVQSDGGAGRPSLPPQAAGLLGRLRHVVRRWRYKRARRRATPWDLPTGFSGERYLQLNPDVRHAGIDPVGHYMLHGRLEGRQYC
jgi:GT2 family glycosyltransferase